jgi:exosome complex protein LRP1
MTEKMLEREKYHEALREEAQLASDSDGEHLEIIDNDEEEEKDEGKANSAVASESLTPIPDVPPSSSAAARKRRRPAIDPFAGLCSPSH